MYSDFKIFVVFYIFFLCKNKSYIEVNIHKIMQLNIYITYNYFNKTIEYTYIN